MTIVFSDIAGQVKEFFQQGGNLVWLLTIVIALTLTPIVTRTFRMVAARLERLSAMTPGVWDDFAVTCLARVKSWVVFVLLSVAMIKVWNTSGVGKGFIQGAMTVAVAAQMGFWGFAAMNLWKEKYLQVKIAQDTSSAAATGLLFVSLKGLLLVTIILMTLSNLGVDIGALLAGLGVSGIAIALAAQNVLGDLLASLSIVLDKPFVVGDFISLGTDVGLVQHIGLKTTRVRSLSGEELIISNKDLLESRIRNFGRMYERRVVHRLGVVYSTPVAKLASIPSWLKEIVTANSKLRFDRCHFAQYGTSTLDIELVFWVLNPDYNLFMDAQQQVLLDIYQKFNDEKVEFAFPTQTVHLKGGIS